MLLPRAQKEAMCALYAFLRHSDDIVDEPGSDQEKRSRLEAWRRGLDCALDDNGPMPGTDPPILPALAHTVRTFKIPRQHLDDALEGVAMDLATSDYATFEDLRAYCYRVASTVGLCCLHIWGFDSGDGHAERMAESCGLAFQLTNIVRDVREDAQRGRVYLPLEDLDRFRVDRHALAAECANARVKDLLAFECARAEEFYRQAMPLEERVAPAGRPMLRAIVGIYHGLLDAIRNAGYDVLARRISLSPVTKATIALRALARGRS